MNGTLTWPFAMVELVITGMAILIVIVRVALPVPPALLALIVTVYVPVVVGVPEMSPVAAVNVRPGGREPVAAKLVGLLVAVI